MIGHPYLQFYENAALVRQTLIAAGFPPGQRQRIAQSGDLKAQLVAGPVVSVRRIWDSDIIREEQCGEPGGTGGVRIYVDHAGRGSAKAMIEYRKALVAAGYVVDVGRLNSVSKKEFLWVKSKDSEPGSSRSKMR